MRTLIPALLLTLAACSEGAAPEVAAPEAEGSGEPDAPKFEPPAGAALESPTRLAVADDGTIFASDPRTGHVFGWRDGRRVLSIRGLRQPLGLAVHGDRLFVGEAGGHAIQLFDWKRQTHLGALQGECLLPTAIAVASDGAIFVADFGAHLVRRWDSALRPAGSFGDGPDPLRFPSAIAVDADTVAVADQGHHRVQLFRRDGTLLRTAGEALPMATSNRAALLGRFTRLQGLAFAGGTLWALDATHGHLQGLDPATGAWRTIRPVPGVALPLDLVATPDGRLLVSDPDRRRWVTLPAEVTP